MDMESLNSMLKANLSEKIKNKNETFLKLRKKQHEIIQNSLIDRRQQSYRIFVNSFQEIAWTIGMYINETITDFEMASISDNKKCRASYNLITASGRKIPIRAHFRSYNDNPSYGNEIKILDKIKLRKCDYVNDDYSKSFLNDRDYITLKGELYNDDFDFFIYGMRDKEETEEVCKIVIIDWKKFRSHFNKDFFTTSGYNKGVSINPENFYVHSVFETEYTLHKVNPMDDSRDVFIYPTDSFDDTGDSTIRIPVAEYFGKDEVVKRFNQGSLVKNFPEVIVYKRGYVVKNNAKMRAV